MKEVKERVRKLKIFTLVQIAHFLACSQRTAQRYMKSWECATSYNANSKYYALPEVIQYNNQALWHCKEASFSRYGNLTETIIGVINNSPSGMNKSQLESLLKDTLHSFLPELIRKKKLKREKHNGAFVYFSVELERKSEQIRRRRQSSSIKTKLTDRDAITVLVALIKEPRLDVEQLAQKVKRQAPSANAQVIKEFLSFHGLTLPKKRK